VSRSWEAVAVTGQGRVLRDAWREVAKLVACGTQEEWVVAKNFLAGQLLRVATETAQF